MVAVSTSTVSHVQDSDKKRKPTLEKAKAHHMCRQLQMRLQYARLKVEHGWQKQSLNEVENLYFHHSHTRGPKHSPPELLATTTHPDDNTTGFSAASNPQSTQSFTVPRVPIPYTTISSYQSNATASSSSTTTAPNASGQMLPPSTTPPGDKTPPGGGSLPLQPALPTPKSPQRQPASLPTPLESPAALTASPRHFYAQYATRPTQFTNPDYPPASLPSPSPSSPSKSRSRTSKAKAKATTSSGNTTTTASTTMATTQAPVSSHYLVKDPFNFTSTSTSGLTYDAFWSSHTTASPRAAAHLRTTMLQTPATTPPISGSETQQQA